MNRFYAIFYALCIMNIAHSRDMDYDLGPIKIYEPVFRCKYIPELFCINS